MPTPDAQPIPDLSAFIDAAPTPFHAVQVVHAGLVDAGFSLLDEQQAWPSEPGRYLVVRDGSLVAWVVGGGHTPTSGFRIVGAHTDSPNLRLKPHHDHSHQQYRQLAVEVYGGVLLNSWLDRDLGVAGRVVGRDGQVRLVRDDDHGVRVPQLAIHLDREISEKGLVLNRQQHMAPIWSLGAESPFLEGFCAGQGLDPEEVAGFDLMLHSLEAPRVLGRDAEMLAAPRIDNLLSCHAGAQAVSTHDETSDSVAVLALFDHEEVGSTTASGAASPLLRGTLERVVRQLGGDGDDTARALAASVMLSADGAHATHPNYADRHEPDHQIALNAGPVIKRNANARYATDAVSEAAFVEVCRSRDIPYQHFVNRTDLACGSTIGPISAAASGIRTIDVGVAQLSMHSIRELCGTADEAWFTQALAGFLSDG
ncbi:MAG: M18 family aminopeptidase [Acidimicrobiales bacterium]